MNENPLALTSIHFLITLNNSIYHQFLNIHERNYISTPRVSAGITSFSLYQNILFSDKSALHLFHALSIQIQKYQLVSNYCLLIHVLLHDDYMLLVL